MTAIKYMTLAEAIRDGQEQANITKNTVVVMYDTQHVSSVPKAENNCFTFASAVKHDPSIGDHWAVMFTLAPQPAHWTSEFVTDMDDICWGEAWLVSDESGADHALFLYASDADAFIAWKNGGK